MVTIWLFYWHFGVESVPDPLSMKWCKENCLTHYVGKLCSSGGMTDDQLDVFSIHRVSVHGKCTALTWSSKTLWCQASLMDKVTRATIMLQLWSMYIFGISSFAKYSFILDAIHFKTMVDLSFEMLLMMNLFWHEKNIFSWLWCLKKAYLNWHPLCTDSKRTI